MSGAYSHTGGVHPPLTAFDVSYTFNGDANLGVLVPIYVQDCLPGDVFQISHAAIIRAQPLVAPIMHQLKAYVHYYFVSLRCIHRDWEKFITGGASGDVSIVLPKLLDRPSWPNEVRIARYGIWDYLGLPIHDGVQPTNEILFDVPSGIRDSFHRAYWFIWHHMYRDENHQPNYPSSSGVFPVGQDFDEQLDCLDDWMYKSIPTSGAIADVPYDRCAYRCYPKDYFTSALPWQQRGISPAIPIGGQSTAIWPTNLFNTTDSSHPFLSPTWRNDSNASPPFGDPNAYTGTANSRMMSNFEKFMASNTVNFGTVGVDISDLRFAVQVQRWLELSARGGYRYGEHLQQLWGVSPRDERLMRPLYLGGAVSPIVISEVLQTSSTDTSSPQGNMAGHGMAVGSGFDAKFRSLEHGIIMGILSIVPDSIYQQGVHRMFTRETRYDYYNPVFASLSEQEIKRGEIYWLHNAPDQNVIRFGFQGAWDEYRTRQNMVCGKLASDLKVWTLSRIFSSPPSLNANFLTMEALSVGRRQAWAVPGVADNTQGQFLIQWRNNVRALRPLPYMSTPGLLDHVFGG